MKNKKILKSILIVTIIAFVVSIVTYSIADVGSFDRYDSGSSSSDWGSSSSSSDWGSSSSWGSSSWDSGSSYSSSSYGSSYSSGDMGFLGFGGTFFLLVFVVIIALAVSRGNKGNNGTNTPVNNVNPQPVRNIPKQYYTQGVEPVVDMTRSPKVAAEIQEFDPLFSEEKMLSWARNLFIKLQNAWTARDWEPMRPFETEELFDQHYGQIKRYIDTNKINIIDRIAVNYATLYSFKQDEDKDVLEIALKATMKDYIIDANTKYVLEGHMEQDRITVYKLTFIRKKGVLTEEGEIKLNTTNCPNCGAPTEITSSGKCSYCGSIITTKDYGWVLSGLEPFRN